MIETSVFTLEAAALARIETRVSCRFQARSLLYLAGLATFTYKHPFIRLSAFTIAVLGVIFLVPGFWIVFVYTCLGIALAGTDFAELKFGTGLLRLGGATLYGATWIFALYLCYGFFRYALQDSQAWRGRFLWASTCSLSGLLALIFAVLSACSRYFYGFWDFYWFWAAIDTLGFTLFTGFCWWHCKRA